jgi:hypothetical protein
MQRAALVKGGFAFVRDDSKENSWKAKLAFQELNINGCAGYSARRTR